MLLVLRSRLNIKNRRYKHYLVRELFLIPSVGHTAVVFNCFGSEGKEQLTRYVLI